MADEYNKRMRMNEPQSGDGSGAGGLMPKDDNKVLSRLLVSQPDLSRIIGKGGQTVSQIRAKCGAVIKGFNLEDTQNKLVIIGGAMGEVLEGFDLVTDILSSPQASGAGGTVNGLFKIDLLVDNARVSLTSNRNI